jgi:hypothetical protein
MDEGASADMQGPSEDIQTSLQWLEELVMTDTGYA